MFSRFAAIYGHLWRSQFKDEEFYVFAKKEWQEALSPYTDTVITKAILHCREYFEMPPTLPQVIQCCRDIRKRESFHVVNEMYVRAKEEVVAQCYQKCKELLTK